MPIKRNTKTQISVTHPKSITLTPEVLSQAAAAAQKVVDDLAATASLQSVLAAHGISVSVEQILALKGESTPVAAVVAAPKKKAAKKKRAARKKRRTAAEMAAAAALVADAPVAAPKKKGAKKKSRAAKRGGKRTPITPETRAAISESLHANEASVAKLCAKYGVSSTTINMIKKSLGLVKPRKG